MLFLELIMFLSISFYFYAFSLCIENGSQSVTQSVDENNNNIIKLKSNIQNTFEEDIIFDDLMKIV